MTASADPVTAAPAKAPSFWEDLIDIFVKPADVLRRWQLKSAWAPLFFVAIAIGVISYFTFPSLQPAIDADYNRGMAVAMAKNPALTQEIVDKGRNFSESIGRYAVGVITFIAMLVVGLVAWLVGKLFGSKQTLQAGIVVAAWAFMPRVLGALITAVQALLLDPTKMTSVQNFSLGPARFYDPGKTDPVLLGMLGRVDLITIWVTVLLAVGLYATGKVTKGRAWTFGVVIWIVGSLPTLFSALRAR